MRTDLLEILRCPVCRGELTLRSDQTADGEVVRGLLTCTKCRETYPIEDGIPDMLSPADRD